MKNRDGLIHRVISETGSLHNRRNSTVSKIGKSKNGALNTSEISRYPPANLKPRQHTTKCGRMCCISFYALLYSKIFNL